MQKYFIMPSPSERSRKILEIIAPEFPTLQSFADFLSEDRTTWRYRIEHSDSNPSLPAQTIVAINNRLGTRRLFQIVAVLAEQEVQEEIRFFFKNP